VRHVYIILAIATFFSTLLILAWLSEVTFMNHLVRPVDAELKTPAPNCRSLDTGDSSLFEYCQHIETYQGQHFIDQQARSRQAHMEACSGDTDQRICTDMLTRVAYAH
jgi:hypothetical protein